MIAHNVYFTLIDSSESAKEHLVDACKKHLARHSGIVSFACGTLAMDLARPVNDRDFDVGLLVLFADKAAHDRYQAAPGHIQFVEENKGSWEKSRVFDTEVELVVAEN